METQDVQDFDSDTDKYIYLVSYANDRYKIDPQSLVDSIKLKDGTCDKFQQKIKEIQSKVKVRELVDLYINKSESHE